MVGLTIVHPCKSLGTRWRQKRKGISYELVAKKSPGDIPSLESGTYSIRGLHGDADTDTGNRTCSEECPETIGGHTGGRDEIVFAQVV